MRRLLFAFLAIAACGTSVDDSEERARAFAKKAGWDVQGVECQKYDSNENDYVSCTLFMPNGVVEAVECPTWDSCNDRCRRASIRE